MSVKTRERDKEKRITNSTKIKTSHHILGNKYPLPKHISDEIVVQNNVLSSIIDS